MACVLTRSEHHTVEFRGRRAGCLEQVASPLLEDVAKVERGFQDWRTIRPVFRTVFFVESVSKNVGVRVVVISVGESFDRVVATARRHAHVKNHVYVAVVCCIKSRNKRAYLFIRGGDLIRIESNLNRNGT